MKKILLLLLAFNISYGQTLIKQNQVVGLPALTTSVGVNTSAISTLSTNLTTLTSSVGTNNSAISTLSTNLSTLTSSVTTNNSSISTLSTNVTANTNSISALYTKSLTLNGAVQSLTANPVFTTVTLPSFSATSPLVYNNTTGVYTIQPSSTSQAGALSSTDWNMFNEKQTRSNSVSAYTISGVGTPSVTLIVSGKIRNPTTGSITTISNMTFSNQAVTHFTATGVTYIGVKEDGTLTQQVGRFTTAQRYNHLTAWVVIYNTTAPFNIVAFNNYPANTEQIGAQFHSYMRNLGAKVLSGGQYSGIGTAGLQLQRAGAVVQDVGWGDLTSDNPNEKTLAALTTTITFDVRSSIGTYTTNRTVIDPTIYEVSSGSVTTVPNPVGNVTVYRLTFFNSNLTRVQLGQTVYSDIDQAVARTVALSDTYVTEQNISDNGVTTTYLAIQKNCTDWTQTTRYRFFPAPQSGTGASATFVTLQQSYDVAAQPQLKINDTKGALQIMSARASNTLSLIEGLNIAGTTTYSLTGNGDVTMNKLTLTSVSNQSMTASSASSSTVDLSTWTGNYGHITGTVTINGFGTVQAGAERIIVFDGALTITSNTAAIILPNNLSIATSTNDVATFRSEGAGVWRLVNYQKGDDTYLTWSPSFTGFSADPSAVTARYTVVGKMVTCYFVAAAGTSNSTGFTITLPFAAANTNVQPSFSIVTDNGTTTNGYIRTAANSNIATVFKGVSATFTASGSKNANFTMVYERN